MRAKTNKGWGGYSPYVYKHTTQYLGEFVGARDDNEQTRIIVGVVIAVIFVIVLMVAIIVFYMRR